MSFLSPGVKCPSFLLPLLGILITSVWLQQPGFSQLFRATQKPLIGIHSTPQADSTTAPTLTITASRGHSFSCYCALEPAPIQNQHKQKYPGAPHLYEDTQTLLFEHWVDTYNNFPAVAFFILTSLKLVIKYFPASTASATYYHGGFIHLQDFQVDVCSLQRGSKQIFLRKDFLIHCIDNLCLTQQRIKCTEGSCPRYSLLN